MSDNKFHTLAAIIGTALVCFLLYISWDSDGYWLRQACLVIAGFAARTVLNILTYIKE